MKIVHLLHNTKLAIVPVTSAPPPPGVGNPYGLLLVLTYPS